MAPRDNFGQLDSATGLGIDATSQSQRKPLNSLPKLPLSRLTRCGFFPAPDSPKHKLLYSEIDKIIPSPQRELSASRSIKLLLGLRSKAFTC